MNYLFSWNTQQYFSQHWMDIKRKTWSAFEVFSHGGHKLITVKYFHSWTNFLIIMVKYECTLDIMISRPAVQKTHAVSTQPQTQPMHIPLISQCAYSLFSNCYSGIFSYIISIHFLRRLLLFLCKFCDSWTTKKCIFY